MYNIGTIVFENWEIVRKIGEGSFGAVYELRREDFGEVYRSALKVIRVPQNDAEVQALAQEGMSERDIQKYLYSAVTDLVREFAIMAKLKATGHIVSYEDHMVLKRDNEIGWDILIRMELLDPLLEYAYQHPFSRRDVIRLGIDICKALELCQKYNIVHRDIKPDNIFVTDSGSFKLGDFGIARTIERSEIGMGLSKKGTYNYMAPEVYGAGGKYGFSVDTYSLGIVLYRLLNQNRTPFLPDPPQPITSALRETALIRRMRGDPIPAPYFGEGRLGEIVLKACAYRPEHRYSSPMQMRQELESILYDADESQLIYPSGDEWLLRKNEYISGGDHSTAKEPQKTQDETVLRDNHTRGRTAEPAPLRGTAGTRRGAYTQAQTDTGTRQVGKRREDTGRPATKKARRRPLLGVVCVAAVLIVIAVSVGFMAARVDGAKEAKQTRYESAMQEAQQCRGTDPQKALSLYLQAQSLFPEEEAPYIAYAYTLYSARQYEACVSYIEDDLALGKHYSEDGQNQLCEILGAAYFEMDDYAAAASFFRLSAAGGSAAVPAMRDYAVSLGRLGDVQAANDVMEKMRAAGASGSVMTYVQAEIDYAMQNYLIAEEGFLSALGTAQEADLQRRALRSLAELYRDCVELDDAGASPIQAPAQKEIELLRDGIARYQLQYDPTLAEMLGSAYYAAAEGNADYLTRAAEQFRRVMDLGIQKDYLYSNLFTIYYEMGDHDSAEQALQDYQDAFPDDHTPHALRAVMLIAIENEKDQSRRDYTRAVEEYEAAGAMIRSGDDTTYYQQVGSLIQQLRANGWIS